jgi:hypothetical protein
MERVSKFKITKEQDGKIEQKVINVEINKIKEEKEI